MIPIEFTEATRKATPPKNWNYAEGPIDSLSIYDYQTENGNVMVTGWLPTEEELACLSNGSILFIHQYGNEPSPLRVSIQKISGE